MANQLVVNAPGKRLGSEPAMHIPFLVPNGFEPTCRDLGQEGQKMRAAECGEAALRLGRPVCYVGNVRGEGRRSEGRLHVRRRGRIEGSCGDCADSRALGRVSRRSR